MPEPRGVAKGRKKRGAGEPVAPDATEGLRIGRRWTRKDYAGPAEKIARKLLGRLLVRTLDTGEVLAGRIVETEAYLGVKDKASHAYGGRRTSRNEVMYGPPGTAYVYFTYGMHFCVNVVCGGVGDPVAVLIRAIEPVCGIDTMARNRAVHAGLKSISKGVAPHQLGSGPAKLCQALSIDRAINGADMVRENRLFVAEPGPSLADDHGAVRRGHRGGRIVRTPRIGVDYAGDWASRPLRFLIDGHPHASRTRTAPQRRRVTHW